MGKKQQVSAASEQNEKATHTQPPETKLRKHRKKKKEVTIGIFTLNAKGIPHEFSEELINPYLEVKRDKNIQIIGLSEPNLNWQKEEVQMKIRKNFS